MIRLIDNTVAAVAERIVTIQMAAYSVEAELMRFDGIPPMHETALDVRKIRDLVWSAAFEEESMIGLIAWADNGESVEIDRLAIHPEWSRRGHGRALVRAVPTAPVMNVSTGTLKAPAIALYESEGFRQVGTTEIAPAVFATQFLRRQTAS